MGLIVFQISMAMHVHLLKLEDKRKYRMNKQTTGFFIVVCIFDRFRSTKTFFKTKHNSEKFPEVLKNG